MKAELQVDFMRCNGRASTENECSSIGGKGSEHTSLHFPEEEGVERAGEGDLHVVVLCLHSATLGYDYKRARPFLA